MDTTIFKGVKILNMDDIAIFPPIKKIFLVATVCLLNACSSGSYHTLYSFDCAVFVKNFSVLEKDVMLHDRVYYDEPETGVPRGYLPALNIKVDQGKRRIFMAAWRTEVEWQSTLLTTTSSHPPGSKTLFAEVFSENERQRRQPSMLSLMPGTDGKWHGTFSTNWKVENGDIEWAAYNLECSKS